MPGLFIFAFLLLAGCQQIPPPPVAEPAATPPVPIAEPAPAPAPNLAAVLQIDTTPAGTRLLAPGEVRAFYGARQFSPAWQEAGRPELAVQLLAAIGDTAVEGLSPDDYHLRQLATLVPTFDKDSEAAAVERELLLTDAFLAIAAHYRYGRLDLRSVLPEWQPRSRNENHTVLLEAALASGDIRTALQRLLPNAAGYLALKNALRHHRQLASQGGWPAIPAGNRMEQGDNGGRVALLRQRLAVSGDLAPEQAVGDNFDTALQGAVRRFQARHGLEKDGVIGEKTLAALNMPVDMRIRQLAANLERWRWLPEDLGRRHIMVNIAGFSLTVVEKQRKVMEMSVIAGRPDRPTPIFSSTIAYLVLNPYWEVPHDIAVKDLLPKVRQDRTYLQRLGIRVLPVNGANDTALDSTRIDWQRLDASRFRYRLRQDPGPTNFLGRIKFIFPNPYSVYLHDTPARELFKQESRAFSSGCVRVEKPLDLAALLLRDTPLGTEQALISALTGGTRTVHLPTPMPIHLLYWTAWVDDQGASHFRPDLYGHDRLIEDGLKGLTIPKPLPCISECAQ